MRYCVWIVIVCLQCALLISCSDNNSIDNPGEVTQRWVDALNAKDLAKARECLIIAGRSMFEEGTYNADFSTLVLGATSIHGDTAEVLVQTSGTSNAEPSAEELAAILLVREEGQWRVAGCKVNIGEKTTTRSFNMTLLVGELIQEAVEEMADSMAKEFKENINRGGSVEELKEKEKRYAASSGLTVEEYKRRWENTKDYTSYTVLEAIQTLAQQSGLAVHPGEHEAVLEAKLEKSLTGLTLLEAIDQAAASVGLITRFPRRNAFGDTFVPAFYADAPLAPKSEFWDTDMPNALDTCAIQFVAGIRRYPLAFSGPFVVGIANFQDYALFGTGELEVRAMAYNIPDGIVGMHRKQGERMRVLKIEAPSGQSLKRKDAYSSSTSTNNNDGALFEVLEFKGLAGLTQEVASIAKIESRLSVPIPQKMAAFSFDKIESGAHAHRDDVEVKITEHGEKQVNVLLEWPGIEKDILPPSDGNYGKFRPSASILAMATDKDGLPVAMKTHSPEEVEGGKVRCTLFAHMPFSSLTVYILRDIEWVSHTFVLKDIPLEQSNERLEKLVELIYEGNEVPVSFEVISAEFVPNKHFPGQKGDGLARVKVTNHSNKPIWRIGGDSDYFDGEGVEVGDFMFRMKSKEDNSEEMPSILLPANTTQEIELELSMVEPEMKQVKLTLDYIQFMDGSVWDDGHYFRFAPESE